MEGTRPIVFREPVGSDNVDHVVYCIRKDRPGSQGELMEGVAGTEGTVELKFREDSIMKRPTNAWKAVDENDVRMKVEDVYEANSGPWARWLIAVCRRVDL